MTLVSLGSRREARRIADVLRAETVGGVLLPGATVVALAGANSPWGNFYQAFAALRADPAQWHLNLPPAGWAADGLLAILIIAIFSTSGLHPFPLLGAALGVAAFGLLVQRGRTCRWVLMPRAVGTWALTHASGVHATVVGVALAFTVPVHGPGDITLVERFEHTRSPISADFAVPAFAFFASRVAVGGSTGAATAAVVLALAAGIGFTVSLLISELAVGPGPALDNRATLGVLRGFLPAALPATVVIRLHNRHHRRLRAAEEEDRDSDGIPDVYQRENE